MGNEGAMAWATSDEWATRYDPREDATQGQRDLYTQLIISVALGFSAFISFCVLRPRWATLYAARKQQSNSASSLPELPDSFFGWIRTLYQITEEEVLHTAGLDAYVFLNFFRMAIKFLAIAFLAVLIIVTPIQIHFHPDAADFSRPMGIQSAYFTLPTYDMLMEKLSTPDNTPQDYPSGYFWMHVVFIYLFTGLLFYLLNGETKKIIKVRQEYLGSQSTVTDRTIRLSGIPPELRSEDKLKDFIEALEIGKVESITLCRNWAELDNLMDERRCILRRLEEAWAVYIGRRHVERNRETLPIAQPPPPEPLAPQESTDESSQLLASETLGNGTPKPYVKSRPTTRIYYGFLSLQSRKVDAIDYYEEKLRRLDEKVRAARRKEYQPTPLAFVTMDSIAACQMAVQAILDSSPSRLLTHVAPAPSDIIWRNTYQSRLSKVTRAWSVTLFVGILSVIWSGLLLSLGVLLDIKSIRKLLPGFAAVLDEHPVLRSLVQAQLTTLVISLLGIAVPFFYDWLSNLQGMISQAEVELSVISKNFFFTFFNLFVFLTIFGSVPQVYVVIRKSLNDTSYIANVLAQQLEKFGRFYINLIVLQGLGLFPFRLLQFGSVSLYPIMLMGAKTPRDFAELVQPPVFKYGFYLPQTLFIFIICIVYSVLPHGVFILFFGLVYFILGYFTYKYQLLYAMEHNQHSTGRGWPIISYRTMLGLGVFHVAMAGWLALKGAFTASAVVVPLIFVTIWFSYFYSRTYQPLMEFIALSSVRRNSVHQRRETLEDLEENVWRTEATSRRRETGDSGDSRDGFTVDEARERGHTFMNPNLISPLEDVWITKRRTDTLAEEASDGTSAQQGVIS